MNQSSANEHTATLVQEMKLERTLELDTPFFTGWKEILDRPHEADAKGTGKFVGQVVSCVSQSMYAYVNLPGMQSGVVQTGGVMRIGDERIEAPITLEAMREMLQKGLENLKAVVEEYKTANA